MDFRLSDEQLALQETARRFAQEEIAPAAAELDQTAEFPREIIRKAWELGLASTCIPQEYGGVGFRSWKPALPSKNWLGVAPGSRLQRCVMTLA